MVHARAVHARVRISQARCRASSAQHLPNRREKRVNQTQRLMVRPHCCVLVLRLLIGVESVVTATLCLTSLKGCQGTTIRLLTVKEEIVKLSRRVVSSRHFRHLQVEHIFSLRRALKNRACFTQLFRGNCSAECLSRV